MNGHGAMEEVRWVFWKEQHTGVYFHEDLLLGPVSAIVMCPCLIIFLALPTTCSCSLPACQQLQTFPHVAGGCRSPCYVGVEVSGQDYLGMDSEKPFFQSG